MKMPKRKYNVMRAFKINEISGVDVPAQEGARVLLMKRHEPKEEPERTPETKPKRRKRRPAIWSTSLTGEDGGSPARHPAIQLP